MENPTEQGADGVFVSLPLPRSRAWLALVFVAASLLSVGGTIEFWSGSPMTAAQGVSSYWAVFFAFHAIAFGGAALIGAFPALAVRPSKALWLALVAGLYAAAFAVWHGHPGAGSLRGWLHLAPPYLPALVPLVAGCLWGNHALGAAEPDSASPDEDAE